MSSIQRRNSLPGLTNDLEPTSLVPPQSLQAPKATHISRSPVSGCPGPARRTRVVPTVPSSWAHTAPEKLGVDRPWTDTEKLSSMQAGRQGGQGQASGADHSLKGRKVQLHGKNVACFSLRNMVIAKNESD